MEKRTSKIKPGLLQKFLAFLLHFFLFNTPSFNLFYLCLFNPNTWHGKLSSPSMFQRKIWKTIQDFFENKKSGGQKGTKIKTRVSIKPSGVFLVIWTKNIVGILTDKYLRILSEYFLVILAKYSSVIWTEFGQKGR